MNHISAAINEPFRFTTTRPYSTFIYGKPQPIPNVIEGLLPEGGLSLLAGPPKLGKSQLSRWEALCVSRGEQFLGRNTQQGEVLILNLEDSQSHLDNCLHELGWNPAKDALIHVVGQASHELDANIGALGDVLSKESGIRLVIIDTLAKFARFSDISDYMKTLSATEKISTLLKKFPKVHVQAQRT